MGIMLKFKTYIFNKSLSALLKRLSGLPLPCQGVQHSGKFICIFFFFLFRSLDLVHDVEVIFHLPKKKLLLTVFEYLF